MLRHNKMKKSAKSATGKSSKNETIRDYSNDPFFIKKANDSKKILEKNGFPPELNNKK